MLFCRISAIVKNLPILWEIKFFLGVIEEMFISYFAPVSSGVTHAKEK